MQQDNEKFIAVYILSHDYYFIVAVLSNMSQSTIA